MLHIAFQDTRFGEITRPDMIFVKKNYATAVLGTRILRKKRVNRDISQFATKERTFTQYE